MAITGSVGTKAIEHNYPYERGLIAETTKHLIDKIDYDDEA